MKRKKRNALSKKIKPLKNRLKSLEQDIESYESRIADIEEKMAKPDFYDDSDEVKKISMEYEDLKSSLSNAFGKWEEIAGRIEFIEQDYDA